MLGVQQITEQDDVMLITDKGKIIRLRGSEISVIGRNTQGVKLIELEPGEKVMALARLAEKDEEPNGQAGEEDLEAGRGGKRGKRKPVAAPRANRFPRPAARRSEPTPVSPAEAGGLS